MVLRFAIFAFMALGLAGFVALSLPATKQDAAAAPPAKLSVLAASGTLPAGALLKPEDIETVELAADAAPAGARADTQAARSELFGAMVRRTLTQHQPILGADVLRPGDHGFLAAVLAPGMRAASVGVDAVTGTAGLIWPGDHVDLILTQDIQDQSVPVGRRFSGETVLRDVRVIAIDQQLVQGAGHGGGGQGNFGGLAAEPTSRTVTLEVTPAEAERVAVATRLGKLALAVRAADTAPDAHEGSTAVTWASDVSPALKQLPPPAARAEGGGTEVHLYEGGAEARDFHF